MGKEFIPFVSAGVVDAAADLEVVVALTQGQKDMLASCVLRGGVVVRLVTGTKTGSPTATLASLKCAWGASASSAVFREAQGLSLGEAVDDGDTEYKGPEVDAKVLAMQPDFLKFDFSGESLDGSNKFAGVTLGLLCSVAD